MAFCHMKRRHTSTVCPIVVFQPLDSDDKLSQQWAEFDSASLPGRRRLRIGVNELPLAVCVDLQAVPWHRPAIVDINKPLRDKATVRAIQEVREFRLAAHGQTAPCR